jgi:hypothetical protein
LAASDHDDRFGLHGSYGRWLIEGNMSDHIRLDFRTDVPEKRHSGKCYHTAHLVHIY